MSVLALFWLGLVGGATLVVLGTIVVFIAARYCTGDASEIFLFIGGVAIVAGLFGVGWTTFNILNQHLPDVQETRQIE